MLYYHFLILPLHVTWIIDIIKYDSWVNTNIILWPLLLAMFLLDFSKPVEPDRLFDCLPNSLRPSSTPSGHKNDSSGKSQSDHNNKQLQAAVYKPLTLIPPRVLPLLHDLAQQMVLAGSPQELLRAYR